MPADEKPEPDVLALLRALPSDAPPEGARDRVFARVVTTLSLAPTPSLRPESPPAEPSVAPPASRALWRSIAGKMALVAAGGVLGAGLHAEVVRQRAPTATIATSSSALPARPHTHTPPSEALPPPALGAPSAQPTGRDEPPPSLRAPSTGATDSERARANALQRERVLLDAARRKVANGEGAHALSLLREHRRRFPRGRLSEERNALLVNALVVTGAYAEARRAAERFHADHPGSFLAPSVDAAIRAIPE